MMASHSFVSRGVPQARGGESSRLPRPDGHELVLEGERHVSMEAGVAMGGKDQLRAERNEAEYRRHRRETARGARPWCPRAGGRGDEERGAVCKHAPCDEVLSVPSPEKARLGRVPWHAMACHGWHGWHGWHLCAWGGNPICPARHVNKSSGMACSSLLPLLSSSPRAPPLASLLRRPFAPRSFAPPRALSLYPAPPSRQPPVRHHGPGTPQVHEGSQVRAVQPRTGLSCVGRGPGPPRGAKLN